MITWWSLLKRPCNEIVVVAEFYGRIQTDRCGKLTRRRWFSWWRPWCPVRNQTGVICKDCDKRSDEL